MKKHLDQSYFYQAAYEYLSIRWKQLWTKQYKTLPLILGNTLKGVNLSAVTNAFKSHTDSLNRKENFIELFQHQFN